jgi:hypothetical protein
VKKNPPFKAAMARVATVGAILLLLSFVWASHGATKAWGDDSPIVVKPSVHIHVSQRSIYKPPSPAKQQSHTTCWVPTATFEVRGPVSAGSSVSVDFTRPDGSLWLHFDLPTDEIAAGHNGKFETPTEGSLDPVESKFTTAIGTYGFVIHLKNALEGTNQTLFAGKFHAGKVSESLGIPQMKNMYNFYVDHDWALPIGYVWFDTRDDADTPQLRVSLWIRGHVTPNNLEGHLFYQGKEIASTSDGGSMETEVEQRTVSDEKDDPIWVLWTCEWNRVRRTTNDRFSGTYFLDKNPGEYDVKVLRDGKLSRDVKFTVGPDGNVVDTGIAAANHLGTKRVVVPVKVLGTLDGTYNAAAWQTDAFYGNPLTGFTAP